jgi:hypothetical protein
LLDAADRLEACHPDVKHDFPASARELAYSFIDLILKPLD